MIDTIIKYIKSKSIHTPRLAIVRFLLALGVSLTLLSNDLDVIANHKYVKLHGYSIRHDPRRKMPLDQFNMFLMMDPEKAKVVILVILAAVATGLVPQVTGVLHFWAEFSLHNYMIIYNGGDDLAYILSMFLLPVCLTDPRLNTWRRKEIGPSQRNIVSNICLLFIWIQAMAMYTDASIAKMFKPQWQNGTAVYYYTSHYRLGAVDWLKSIEETFTLTPVVGFFTWFVLAFELVLVAAVFYSSKWKRRLIIPAMIFHFLFLINFGLITFYISILALLMLYLDDDEYCVKLLNWFRGKLRLKPL